MSLLRVTDLAVQFKDSDSPTVSGLSFEVDKGETTAIVGESGSGKSISALSILGLNHATYCPEGKIVFDNQNLLTLSEPLRQKLRGSAIGVIFQEPMTALNPLHSIEKQLSEPYRIHQPTLADVIVRDKMLALLDEVGLSYLKDRLNAYPHQLSGGERQRVMIAMAIANRPSLLIADEPTTALDVSLQSTIISLLRDLQHKHQMALLLITHDLHLVRGIADQVVVMQGGQAVESSEAIALFSDPQHPYTKKLLAAAHGSSPLPRSKNQQPVISCDQLSVSYAKPRLFVSPQDTVEPVLNKMNLTVRKGETLGVVGESGSGKTTLGLALARLIGSQGRVIFQGTEISSLKAKQLRSIRAKLQFVFQDPFSSLNPRMNIDQIIGEGLHIHRELLAGRSIADCVIEVLESVGLDPQMKDRYPHEFSGGQRQRINIARAMVLKPDCVIFDEPTSALDMTLQIQIIDLLKSFQRDHGVAYVFISHDMHSIRSISHDIMVLKSGKIIEYSDADHIVNNPSDPYTRMLIEASNFTN